MNNSNISPEKISREETTQTIQILNSVLTTYVSPAVAVKIKESFANKLKVLEANSITKMKKEYIFNQEGNCTNPDLLWEKVYINTKTEYKRCNVVIAVKDDKYFIGYTFNIGQEIVSKKCGGIGFDSKVSAIVSAVNVGRKIAGKIISNYTKAVDVVIQARMLDADMEELQANAIFCQLELFTD